MKNNSYTLLQGSNSGITRLKLNDPGTYNSLSTIMLKSLISRFKELDKDQKTRVIIIEGSGKGFSAGQNSSSYHVSKAALKMFTESLANELWKQKIED